ncbi:trypsin-like peptidase domain-containing protein [Roseomonas aerophila]|uniref:Trypsin-like peptidase domain-containing protein n=1 Tax=Teichococcus aerophilus TaxID=1224513 RepID=A0ABR7RK05_9PROT|nr:trypsin-like peptidase domain-containing protein [Pseudoroseomonas aerophila]MBC9206455.1 trypsin-like peptidase domain-containing protein [Pseudoroseomonas aerophila]
MAIGLWAAGPAMAEPVIPRSELPGLGGAGARQPVDAKAAPWRSLGRVQTELGSRCTGALIAPDRVLTAAHCLLSPRAGGVVQPGSIHFLLGYAAGRYTAHARVAAFRLAPGYQPASRGPASADWAILHLAAPLAEAPPLPLAPARAADTLMLGGYQQDRAEVILADTACRLLGLRRGQDGPVLLHDCAGTRGASGAPLLRRDPNGDWSVIGIAVAAIRGQSGGLGIPAQAILP